MVYRPKLENRLKDYATYHCNPLNQFCHLIGIPLILWTLLGLLSRWVLGPYLNGALLLVLGSLLWLTILDWRLTLPFGAFILGFYHLGRVTHSMSLLGIFFALGWVFQLVGHGVFEKRSPAFLKNIEHLFVGPLWVFLKICSLTGPRPPIKKSA